MPSLVPAASPGPRWVPGQRGGSVPCTLVVPSACGSALLLLLIAARCGIEEGAGGCTEEPEPVCTAGIRAGAAAPAGRHQPPPSVVLVGAHHGGDGDLGAAHGDAEQSEHGTGWLQEGTGSVGPALPDPPLSVLARTLTEALASPSPEVGTVPTG